MKKGLNGRNNGHPVEASKFYRSTGARFKCKYSKKVC